MQIRYALNSVHLRIEQVKSVGCFVRFILVIIEGRIIIVMLKFHHQFSPKYCILVENVVNKKHLKHKRNIKLQPPNISNKNPSLCWKMIRIKYKGFNL